MKYFLLRNRINIYFGWFWNFDLIGSDFEFFIFFLNGVFIFSDIGDVFVKGGVFVYVLILFILCLFFVFCMDFIKVVYKLLFFCLMYVYVLCV